MEDMFKQEEKSLLVSVDKARISSNNSQVIGRNGEIPLLKFLNNYLPPTLKAVSGHFITRDFKRSPQIDIMIIDARYPLLGYNSDGTVLVMAHCVLKIIEVKTKLSKVDVKKTSDNFYKIRLLLSGTWNEKIVEWNEPFYALFSYKISVKQIGIENAYLEYCDPDNNPFNIIILRPKQNEEHGVNIHFEPMKNWGQKEKDLRLYKTKSDFFLIPFWEQIPLSDFYYSLIQYSYNILDSRSYSFADIAEQFDYYLNPTTRSDFSQLKG